MSEAKPVIELVDASGPADMDHVRSLFREYQEWLGVDLCFQGFENELSSLPGDYVAPLGCLILARDRKSGAIAGGGGFRPIDDGTCEMKRLYVRPPWRGTGLGRWMAEELVRKAKSVGYRKMCLDTLGHLKAAIGLYKSMGFREIPSYYDNPLDDVIYMEAELTDRR